MAVHAGAQTTADTAALAAHAAEAGADAVAVIGPPYYALDEEALYEHFLAAARACEPLPFYLYEFNARCRLLDPARRDRAASRDAVPNLRGLKVSNQPFDAVEPYLLEGLDVFVGAEGAGRSRASSAAPRAPSRASPPRSRSWSRGSCTSARATSGRSAPRWSASRSTRR